MLNDFEAKMRAGLEKLATRLDADPADSMRLINSANPMEILAARGDGTTAEALAAAAATAEAPVPATEDPVAAATTAEAPAPPKPSPTKKPAIKPVMPGGRKKSKNNKKKKKGNKKK